MAKVLIAIPSDGNMKMCLFKWFLSYDKMGHDVQIYPSELRPIEANRIHIRRVFLAGDYDWLLQVDADMQPPTDLLRMIDNDKDVCGPDFRTVKNGNVIRMALRQINNGEYLPSDGNGLFECDALGGGCLLTSRKAMQAVDYNYMCEDIKAEDFDWCKRAKEAGFSIWCDARFRSLHYTVCPI